MHEEFITNVFHKQKPQAKFNTKYLYLKSLTRVEFTIFDLKRKIIYYILPKKMINVACKKETYYTI